ncbi:MAG: HEPN domain-containing protein [Bryobacteraceae bacterium]
MTPEIEAVLDKARESLKGAHILSSGGLFDFAASRAYYAMFHGAEALLFSKGLAFSKDVESCTPILAQPSARRAYCRSRTTTARIRGVSA